MMLKKIKYIGLICSALSITACAPQIPEGALDLSTQTVQIRQLQTRTFKDKKLTDVLSAGVGVMQDFGIKITATDKKLGLIVGEKITDATHTGEVVGMVLLAALAGTQPTWSETQKLRSSLFVRKIADDKIELRITFQNVTWNNHGQISSAKTIEEPNFYQDFFAKLSKAAFLEEYKI
jgi:hypothetical protein